MTIKNTKGLHPALVLAIEAQSKSHPTPEQDGRFASVTECIMPSTMFALHRVHREAIVEEAEGRLWALYGTALHKYVEEGTRGTDSKWISEYPVRIEVGGDLVTGLVDLYSQAEGWLSDMKFTSVWSVIFGDRLAEWCFQTQCYALGLAGEGLPVRRVTIEPIYRDWSAAMAKRTRDYPQSQWGRINVPAAPQEKVLSDLAAMIGEHKEALGSDMTKLPPCSPKDRWQKSTVWAVMKEGRKSALRRCESPEEADNVLAAQKKPDQCYIEERPGRPVRCLDYCAVSPFCPWWQSEGKAQFGGME